MLAYAVTIVPRRGTPSSNLAKRHRAPLVRSTDEATDPETIEALLTTASPDTAESFPRIPWARGP